MKPWQPIAQVIRVTDGDTFHALLDIGWGIQLKPRTENGIGTVRVVHEGGARYDCPEKRTALGREAHQFITGLVRPGETVQIVSYHLDDFGRTLASVTLPDGRDWAWTMVQAGYVKEVK